MKTENCVLIFIVFISILVSESCTNQNSNQPQAEKPFKSQGQIDNELDLNKFNKAESAANDCPIGVLGNSWFGSSGQDNLFKIDLKNNAGIDFNAIEFIASGYDIWGVATSLRNQVLKPIYFYKDGSKEMNQDSCLVSEYGQSSKLKIYVLRVHFKDDTIWSALK